jgi:magnesium chelatase accessory protein
MSADRLQWPQWDVEGASWPHRRQSRFVEASGLRWHVQVMGQGPRVWLLHGTGAATHSWRDVMPRLAERFTVLAPDLPGHGFTSAPAAEGMTLTGMASHLAGLMEALGPPALGIGHSAGAALLCRMGLDHQIAPRLLVGINAALQPFGGAAGRWFGSVARVMASSPLPRWVAWSAKNPRSVRRLADGTGSRLDDEGVELYRRLTRCSGHVASTLRMMADWDLPGLHRDLPQLRIPVLLIAGAEDRAVPCHQAEQEAARLPQGRAVVVGGLGHLSHEEDPEGTVDLILRAYDGTPSE